MKFRWLLVSVMLPFTAIGGPGESARSPHVEALILVFQTQEKRIAELDHEHCRDWWTDGKNREWLAYRPVMPGIEDTTHDLLVIYRIDAVAVAAWSVDTRRKAVEEVRVPNQLPEPTAASGRGSS